MSARLNDYLKNRFFAALHQLKIRSRTWLIVVLAALIGQLALPRAIALAQTGAASLTTENTSVNLQIESSKAKEIYLRLLGLGKAEQLCANGTRFIQTSVITCTRQPAAAPALSGTEDTYQCEVTIDLNTEEAFGTAICPQNSIIGVTN
jgi:hypothetical protein